MSQNLQDIFDTAPLRGFVGRSDEQREKLRQLNLGKKRNNHEKLRQRHDRAIMTPTGATTVWTLREQLVATGVAKDIKAAAQHIRCKFRNFPTEYYYIEESK